MVGQMDIKRQVRYKDSIYDILKDINLGNHNYLIIGKGSDTKFFDIDFVEQIVDDGKVKYVSSGSIYQFNKGVTDVSRLQGQTLMSYIVNGIKDNINQGTLADSVDTMHYIDEVAKITETTNDIKGFFVNNNSYDSEEKFEESMKILVGYYDKEIKNYMENKKLPIGDVLVPDEYVAEVYDELENTQNFGVSAIYDHENKQSNDYIVDPTNNVLGNTAFKPTLETNMEQEATVNTESIISDNVVNNTNINVEESNLSVDSNNNEEVKESSSLSFQERLYLENEERMRNASIQNTDMQNELNAKVKTKTLTLSNQSRSNAAYITMSFFIYLIGSFELLLAIILLAKFL